MFVLLSSNFNWRFVGGTWVLRINFVVGFLEIIFWRFLELFQFKRYLFFMRSPCFEKNRQTQSGSPMFAVHFPDMRYEKLDQKFEDWGSFKEFWSTKQKQRIPHCQLGFKLLSNLHCSTLIFEPDICQIFWKCDIIVVFALYSRNL
jgi:hypothetical protein